MDESRFQRLENDVLKLEAEVVRIRTQVGEMQTSQAVISSQLTQIHKDIEAFSTVLNRLVWLVVGSVVTAAMTYLIQGGFAGG